MGYIIPDGDDDAKVDAMERADAGAKDAASTLAGLFEDDLFPDAEDEEEDGKCGEEGGGS